MDQSEAYEFAAELSKAAVDGRPTDWVDGLQALSALEGREWLLLDGAARWFRPATGTPVSGVRGWLGPSADEPTSFVAIVASLHVDGRIRERATRVLAQRSGPLVASAVALRLMDHVPQVRDAAVSALDPVVTVDVAEQALAVVLAGRARQQGPVALDLVETRLRGILGDERCAESLSQSVMRDVRRRGFEFAHDEGLLTRDRLLSGAKSEKGQLLLAWFSDWLSALLSPEDFGEMLTVKSVPIRQIAVIRVSEEALPDEKLLRLAADAAPRVREAAQSRARRRGLNVAHWYRSQLAAEGPVGFRAAVFDGLLSLGSAEDLDRFRGALTDAAPRVRATAVRGVATWGDSDDAARLLLPMLLDPSPRVTSVVARVLGRAGVSAVDAEFAWTSDQVWSRRAAWRLSRSTGSWSRVAADLRAACDSDPDLAGATAMSWRSKLVCARPSPTPRPDGRLMASRGRGRMSGFTSALHLVRKLGGAQSRGVVAVCVLGHTLWLFITPRFDRTGRPTERRMHGRWSRTFHGDERIESGPSRHASSTRAANRPRPGCSRDCGWPRSAVAARRPCPERRRLG